MLNVIPVDGGLLSSRSYIIQFGDGCWIVDCGDYPTLRPYIYNPIRGILLTHGHFDHIRGLNELLYDFPYADIYTNAAGNEMLMDSRKNLSHYHSLDFYLNESSSIHIVRNNEAVSLTSKVDAIPVFTPGHNPSCITWIINDAIFTGDSFIPGLKTVTNLPGGNRLQANESLNVIKELSIGRIIYPGHHITI